MLEELISMYTVSINPYVGSATPQWVATEGMHPITVDMAETSLEAAEERVLWMLRDYLDSGQLASWMSASVILYRETGEGEKIESWHLMDMATIVDDNAFGVWD